MSTPFHVVPIDSTIVTSRKPSLAVGIPTRGRPTILYETIRDLQQQTRRPDAIFVAYCEPSDISNALELFPEVHFIQGFGTGGSCAQRNRLLESAGEQFDFIFIMDDDCYLHRDYLLRVEQTFTGDATVVGLTGRILLNGAKGPGVPGEHARSLLRAIPTVPTLAEQPPLSAFNTDGCNMGFRMSAIRAANLRFDEEMPGYAWYEDIDFSRRLLPYGRLVLVPGAQAVHLGAKVGKTSGRRYGYSQVANPIYLARKGTYPWPNAFRSTLRNTVANLLHSIRSEPFIDRRGRLKGNLLAYGDLLRGRLRPNRILQL